MIYRRMFGLPTWKLKDQFEELERIRRKMDALFGSLTGGSFQKSRSGVFPPVNLTEDVNSYYLRAELPGVKAEDLDIQATGNNIAISGERKNLETESEAKYHRRERDKGKFSRVVSLPDYVNSEKVEARLVDGILTVTIPKTEAAKPRHISIK